MSSYTIIKIQGGKLSSLRDPKMVVNQKGTSIRGREWEVQILGDSIVCLSRYYSNDGRTIYHRVYPLKDGYIGLDHGRNRKRFSFWRSPEFQEFLWAHQLDTVKRVDPNSLDLTVEATFYQGPGMPWGNLVGGYTSVFSDGCVNEDWGVVSSRGDYRTDSISYTVQEATWVVVQIAEPVRGFSDVYNYRRVLYTLQDPLSLDIREEDLPLRH